MSENTQTVSVLKVYLKDSSFEAPKTPDIFPDLYNDKNEPDVEVSLRYEGRPLDHDNLHEVVLSITVTASIEDTIMYVAEVHQAGVFELVGFDQQVLDEVLGVFCPTQLYPYAREALSSAIGKGGFPPLLLDHQNFETIYSQSVKDEAQTSTQH